MLLFWRIVGLAVPRHLGRARFCSHELSLSGVGMPTGYIPQIWGMMISPLSSFYRLATGGRDDPCVSSAIGFWDFGRGFSGLRLCALGDF